MSPRFMASEWRQDPVHGTWVIIAPERAGRPDEFHDAPSPTAARAAACPFCEGNERETPGEILARRSGGAANGPGWTIRVIPNKFPAVRREPSPEADAGDPFVRRDGLGAHEVIIESPRHAVSLTDLEESEVTEALRVYKDRIVSLKRESRFAYALVFKNVGAQGGASVEHVHSQLLATPFVPDRTKSELDRAEAYRKKRGTCLRCDLIASENAAGRAVLETDHFSAYAPFASRLPYETHVLPRRHGSRFEETEEAHLADLARCLRDVLGRIERAASRRAYNVLVHTAPLNEGPLDHFHWYIEILPRLTRTAGFEWGTGITINTVSPEAAARRLREP